MALFDDASLVVTPNGYKEGTLYSIKPTSGLGDMTVVRATTATRVNSAGLIELVPYNLVQYSEQFNNAAWTKGNGTITANATTSPDGTANADKFAEDTSTDAHYFGNDTATATSGQSVTFTIFAKASERSWIAIRLYNGGSSIFGWYNIGSGTLGTIGAGGTGTIENYSNGWYRCSLTITMVSNSVCLPYAFSSTGNGTITFTGTSGSGFFAWGAQLVEGTLPKDYLRTETRLNIPRLDYSNGTCPSLLVEPQSTNLYPYSEDLTQWTTSGSPTVTGNDSISPDGTTNADRVQFNASGNLVYISGTGSAGTNVLTVYAKAKTGTAQKFRFFANGATLISSDFTATNQWQRFEFSYTYSAQTAGLQGASTGASDVLFWGFQHEVSNYATSYIPTTTAAVTRNADVISKTGISSLIGQTEGTIFVEEIYDSSVLNNGGLDDTLISLTDGTSNNLISIFHYGGGIGTVLFFIRLSNVTQVGISSSKPTSGTYKIALAYKNNDVVGYINGVQIGTDTSASIPATSAVVFYDAITTNSATKKVNLNSAVLFPTRLTNAELASLTTL